MNRDELIEEAKEMDLGDLAKKVLYGEYTMGVHDTVLVDRCHDVDCFLNRDVVRPIDKPTMRNKIKNVLMSYCDGTWNELDGANFIYGIEPNDLLNDLVKIMDDENRE